MKRKLSCLFLVFSLLFASIATNNVFAEPDPANVEPIISSAEVTLSLQDGTVLSYNENTQVFDKLTESHSISDITVTVTYGGTTLTFDSDYTIVWWKKNSSGAQSQMALTESFQTENSYSLNITNKNDDTDNRVIPFTLAQEVESISFAFIPIGFYIGDTQNVDSIVFTPSNVFNTNISWSSENESIATVDSSGNVTGIAEGSTKIWATSVSNPDIKASVKIFVESSIDELPLKRTSATMHVGDTLDLTTSGDELIDVLPKTATSFNVKWETDNEEVATVDSNGTVTALKLGTATITVTGTSFYSDSDTKSATCNIEVIEAGAPVYPTAPAITLDTDEITACIGGFSFISFTVEPEDAIETLLVEPEDSTIVQTGIVQDNIIGVFGIKEGTTTINVTSDVYPSMKASCKVTVKKPTITALNPTYNKDLWDRDDDESRKHRIIALIDTPVATNLISNIKIKNTGSIIPVEPLNPGDIQDSEWLSKNANWLKENLDIDVLKVTPICLKNGVVEEKLGLGTYTIEIELMDDETTTVTTTLTIVGSKTDYDDLTWVKGSSEGLTIATIPNLTADLLKKKFTFEDLSLTKDFINNYWEIDDDIFNIDADGNIIIKKELLNILARDLEEDAYFNIEATLRENGPDMDENTRDIKLDVNFKILLTAPSTGNGDTGNGSGGGGYYDNVTTNFTDDATCTHEWTDATCTTPKTCSKCGETEGQALGHNYKEEVIAPTSSFLGATFCTCSNTGCNSSYYKDYTLLAGSHPTYLPDGRTISGNVTSTSTTVNRNGTNLNIILEDPLGVITKSGDTFTLEATQLADTSSLDSTHAIEYIHAYEINPVVNGNKISGQLSNKVRMLYEIPSDWDKADLQVVLMQSGSDVEFDEKTEILNGKEYLVIWTDHFSPYGFIDTLSADEKAQGQTGVTFVKTGESNVCLVTALLLSTISAGLFLEICLRKKFKKQ